MARIRPYDQPEIMKQHATLPRLLTAVLAIRSFGLQQPASRRRMKRCIARSYILPSRSTTLLLSTVSLVALLLTCIVTDTYVLKV